MKKIIKVYDDIINSDLCNIVEDLTLKQFDHGITYNFFNKFYSFHPDHTPPEKKEGFGFGNIYLNTELPLKSYDMLFFNQILYQACFSLNLIVKKIYNARIWLLTPEKENYICEAHTDMTAPHLVGLYYINDSDGDTIFFDEDKTTIIKKVSPKKGRIVFFDGSIPHASSTPTKNIRSVINYNFYTINHNKL